MWKVESFGQDSLGNISGWQVVRRSDRETQVAQRFVGNIYVEGSFDQAWSAAQSLCAHLNGSRTWVA